MRQTAIAVLITLICCGYIGYASAKGPAVFPGVDVPTMSQFNTLNAQAAKRGQTVLFLSMSAFRLSIKGMPIAPNDAVADISILDNGTHFGGMRMHGIGSGMVPYIGLLNDTDGIYFGELGGDYSLGSGMYIWSPHLIFGDSPELGAISILHDNVGINIDLPTHPFEVKGSTYVQGNVSTTGKIYTTGLNLNGSNIIIDP